MASTFPSGNQVIVQVLGSYGTTCIIGHYNPSVRSGLLTPLMLCALILYVSDGTYCLKTSTSNDSFEKFFMAGLLISKFFLEICLEEIVYEIFFIFLCKA